MQISRAALTASLFLVLPACSAWLTGDPAVTPQRPTLSSDTSTTAEGTFEIEAGVVVDPDDTQAVQTFLKWGIEDGTEVFAGVSPFVTVSRPGPDAEGASDLQVGLRHRFLDEGRGSWAEGDWHPSLAFQLVTKLPTARRSTGFSSGETDFFASGIATKTLGPVATTAFYQLGVLGRPGAGTDLEHGFALAGSGALTDRVGLFAEVAALSGSDQTREQFYATFGATYAVAPDLVFDIGLLTGLDSDAPDVQLIFGVTTNLGPPSGVFRAGGPGRD